MKSRRRGPGNYEDPRKQISTSLDMSSISIKTMKLEFCKSYQLFYFQVRESLSPINTPSYIHEWLFREPLQQFSVIFVGPHCIALRCLLCICVPMLTALNIRPDRTGTWNWLGLLSTIAWAWRLLSVGLSHFPTSAHEHTALRDSTLFFCCSISTFVFTHVRLCVWATATTCGRASVCFRFCYCWSVYHVPLIIRRFGLGVSGW